MNRTTVMALVIVVIVLVGLNGFQYYQFTQLSEDHSSLEDDYGKLEDDYNSLEQDYDELLDDYNSLEESYPRSIGDLKGPDKDKYIGKNVTVQGYFVNIANKMPMLVSNPDYLMIDTMIPEDKFLNLTGDIPEELVNKTGARVDVLGTAQAIAKEVVLEFIGHEVIELPLSPWIEIIRNVVLEPVNIWPNKYAVLISGGASAPYLRYWNDLKYMYSILVNRYGYRTDHIYVIYKNGIGEDTQIPVNYSATVANVQTVFNDLATKMTTKDQLFLFLNNHGGGFHPTVWPYNFGGLPDTDGDEPEVGYSEAFYGMDLNGDGDTIDTVKIDETLCLYGSQVLSDDTMADMLDDLDYHKVIIFMKQCFCGGFIHDLSGTNRIILASTTQEHFSYGRSANDHGEFSYHFMRAVDFVDENADGYGDADTNYDYAISMVEAFNYASQEDTRNETPHYDDNGDQVGHTEPIPNGGDGTIGSSAFL